VASDGERLAARPFALCLRVLRRDADEAVVREAAVATEENEAHALAANRGSAPLVVDADARPGYVAEPPDALAAPRTL